MKRPRKAATDRAKRFVSALATETRDRPNCWVSIQTVANRLGMPGEDAIKLADECARQGLVMHDQSQHTKADRKATVRPTQCDAEASGREAGEADEGQSAREVYLSAETTGPETASVTPAPTPISSSVSRNELRVAIMFGRASMHASISLHSAMRQ